MGRTSDAAGKENWVNALKHGTLTREEVFSGFANSAEFKNICSSYKINAGVSQNSENKMIKRAVIRNESTGKVIGIKDYDKNGYLVKYTMIMNNSGVENCKYIEYTYDSKGNSIGYVRKYQDGSIDEREVITLNENGDILTVADYYGDGDNWYRRSSFEYDSNGKISKNIQEYYGYDNEFAEYQYSNNYHHLKVTSKDKNGKILYQYVYDYNDNGDMLRDEFYQGEILSCTTYYEYDEKCQLIGTRMISGDGTLLDNTTYEYDRWGNMVNSTSGVSSSKYVEIYENTYY